MLPSLSMMTIGKLTELTSTSREDDKLTIIGTKHRAWVVLAASA